MGYHHARIISYWLIDFPLILKIFHPCKLFDFSNILKYPCYFLHLLSSSNYDASTSAFGIILGQSLNHISSTITFVQSTVKPCYLFFRVLFSSKFFFILLYVPFLSTHRHFLASDHNCKSMCVLTQLHSG